jgi:hypothetical protein
MEMLLEMALPIDYFEKFDIRQIILEKDQIVN